MGFDHRAAVASAAFHDVWVNRPLGHVFKATFVGQLLRFRAEDFDEKGPDDFALLFRIAHALELFKISFPGVDPDEVQIEIALRSKHRFDLVAFILAHQAVIDEHAGQLLADSLGKQHSRNGRVDAAGQAEEHPVASNFFF